MSLKCKAFVIFAMHPRCPAAVNCFNPGTSSLRIWAVEVRQSALRPATHPRREDPQRDSDFFQASRQKSRSLPQEAKGDLKQVALRFSRT
jgi:hypothetical protein